MKLSKSSTDGRGSQINTHNKFTSQRYEAEDYLDEDFPPAKIKTTFYEENARKIVNATTSPDVFAVNYLNPYQGCEHGCIYCYARNSHEYWGFSAGVDFESKIMVKKNAAELLEQKFQSKSWVAQSINLSGNTDCYQPAEKKYQITRKILEVCLKYRNPVGILTKNGLVLRDLDLLTELAKNNLVHVFMSITTLNEKLRLALEPRTATASKRLKTLETLSNAGIPTGVMTAPIIPGLNDQEIPKLIEASANAGALSAGYTVVRLNGSIAEIFTDWIRKTFPDKADKVLNQIADCHGGKLNDSRFGTRMVGEGRYAENIRNLHQISVNKYLKGRVLPPYDTSHFIRNGQLNLF
jgi:DNA repair photolyase